MKQDESRCSGPQSRNAIKSFVAIALLLALCLDCKGQTPSRPDRWDAVQQLLPGDDVAVKLKDGRTLKGKVAGVTATALTLSRDGRPDDIAKDRIKVVHWLAPRSRQSRKRWAGVGGLGGFLGGVVTAVALSENTDSASKTAAGIAVVGGLLGGVLLGWTLGGRRRRVLIYETS